MKSLKKILAMMLALIMVLSLIPTAAFAAGNAAFTVSTATGYPGDEVTVTVNVENNPGLFASTFTVEYDTDRLEKVEYTPATIDGVSITNKDDNFLWENTATEMANTQYNGKALDLKFKIKNSAALGDAEIKIVDLLVADCEGDPVTFNAVAGKITVVAKPVTGVTLNPTTLSLDQGGTGNLTATVEPADAGDKTVTWTTSDKNVATVADGVVTAVGAGSATITAKAGEFEATCAVTVAGSDVPVTGITLDKSAFYLYGGNAYVMAGNSAALTATVTPDYATDKTVTWNSSNESVATVVDGVVTAVAPGSVTITAAAGNVSETCAITVIDNPFTVTADDETVVLQYADSGTMAPNSLRYYRLDVPNGTDIVKISGSMTNWAVYSGPAIVDNVMTIDLSTYARSGDYWKIDMGAKNGNMWGAQHVIRIYMDSCEGDHTFADATCTAPATCTVCYATQGEALGHDWEVTTEKVEPDCENAGTEAIETCKRGDCGATQGGQTIAALGHTWKSTGINPKPTCTEPGTESFICIRTAECDGKKTETVDALGHTWNEGSVTKDPTCTTKGVKHFECTVDGCEGAKDEDIPANGHSYVEGYCSVCQKKEPTLIPFTKANHTDSGAAINDKFTGVVGLEVDGVTLADWSEWVQGGNYQTQSITIYVAAEDKDKAATFTLLLADGQTGSGNLINQTATVQLNNGVGSYSASGMVIGTGGLAPRLNLNITFKHELCEEHTWVDANCTTPKTCSVCALTEGEALGHTWNEGIVTTEPSCTNTGVKSFECTVDGCDGTKTETLDLLLHNFVEGTCQVCNGTTPFTIKSGDTTLIPVQIDAVNCTRVGKNVVAFNLTVPEGTTSLDFSGSNFYLYNAETHKTLVSNKTSYSLSLTNGCISVCYRDRSSGIYYHINILHTWKDVTCTAPKTCANCGKTEGEALGHDWNEAGTCTRCNLANTITEIEVSHPSIEKNEETGVMTMAMVAGGSEKIDVSFGLVDAAVASTQEVAWFSSDEEVATVDKGTVTALKAGTTTITAKAVDASGIALLADGEEVLAEFTLTVSDPEEGYTVTMGDDVMNTVIGSNVSIPVTIGHTGEVTKYNAFDLSFSYDPAILELTSTAIEGMTVDYLDENQQPTGNVHIERYGDDMTAGQTAFTLTFKAIATGETEVEVTSAKVDISESALTKDAPDASVIDELTRVSVTGYTVNLPEDFTGDSSVMPGEDYTFTPKNQNYSYTVTAKIGEDEITVPANENGSFTISAEDITGNIVITVTEKTGKVFTVTPGEDMEGAESAQYMTNYTATLTKKSGSNYRVTVTIGGTNYTGFSSKDNGDGTETYTIPGEDITGDIVFDSHKSGQTQDKHSVQFKGEYGDIADNTAVEVENGTDYVLTINKLLGYKYTVTATMGGEAATVTDNLNGTYTVANVTGDLVFTITKESDLAVDVKSYVTLNGTQMFLVTATASVDTGKVLSYDGNAMFFSKQYADPEVEGDTGKWVYLVLTDGTLSADDAKAKITLTTGTKVELSQTYNVNETPNESVDINDAQLVYDMYNNKYQTIEEVTMQKFLKADVNGDMKIDVNDAVAVVETILKTK